MYSCNSRQAFRPWLCSVSNQLLCVSLLILVVAPFGTASGAPTRVLLLNSFGRELGPFDAFNADFRTELERQSRAQLEFFEVSLQPGSPNEDSEETVVSYLQSIFASRPPDLIVPIGGPASAFAHKYRQRLFFATPMLITAIDQRRLPKGTFTTTEAIFPLRLDVPQVIETIRGVLPHTSTIFVVIGNSLSERIWREDIRREFQRFQDQLMFVWGNELTFDEMLKRCATLPPNSAILYVALALDAAGSPQTEAGSLAQLHAVANAPVFGLFSSQLGKGIVGGPLMSIDDFSRNAAAAGVRLLNHESPENVRTPPQLPGPDMFDWRELRRWDISENLLPVGSVMQFREPTPWQRYKWYVFAGVLVCFVEALLISSLFVNLARRRRAERSLRESREALSKMSQRLIEAQERERSWIALELHDDINQRLAAVKLQLSLSGKSLPSSIDAAQKGLSIADRHLAELITDIQALSRRLYSASLKHLGLAHAAEDFCSEFSATQQIEIQFHSEKISKDMPDDIRLCLFRVLEEALQNVAKHSGAKRSQVLLIGGQDTVELTVHDDGTGFNPERVWIGGGMGLLSMKQRLMLVNGQISINSEPGRGTVIQATVPLQSKKKAAQSG